MYKPYEKLNSRGQVPLLFLMDDDFGGYLAKE
jgi:hypothetical protein